MQASTWQTESLGFRLDHVQMQTHVNKINDSMSMALMFSNSVMDLHDFIDLSTHDGRGHKKPRKTHYMKPKVLGTRSSTISLEKHGHFKYSYFGRCRLAQGMPPM